MGTGRAAGGGGADTFVVIVWTSQRVDAAGSRPRTARKLALLALAFVSELAPKNKEET